MWELPVSFAAWLIRAWGVQVAVLRLTRRRFRPLRFVTVVPVAVALITAGLGCGAGAFFLMALPMPISAILLGALGLGVGLVSGGWGAACLVGWALAWWWEKTGRGEGEA